MYKTFDLDYYRQAFQDACLELIEHPDMEYFISAMKIAFYNYRTTLEDHYVRGSEAQDELTAEGHPVNGYCEQ